MVTTIRKVTGGDHPFYEFACLSTDTKPTSLVPENSICHEIDTGKHFYCSNGEWKELPPKGGSGGGGLPADFPAEGSANANKFLGFDANGDYTAKDAPSGGGAEKFVVTLTQDEQTEEWTANKTVAEIVAADAAGKIVVAKYPFEGTLVDIPLFTAETFSDDGVEMSAAVFTATVAGEHNSLISFGINASGSTEDEWGIEATNIEIPTTAPLIVTLTAGQEAGQYVGNMTFAEIHAAATAGRTVVFVVNIEGDEYVMYCISSSVVVESSNTVYQVYYINAGDIAHFDGGASDYPSLS